MATTPKGDQSDLRRMVVRDLARKVAGLRTGGGTATVPTRRLPLSVSQATPPPSLRRALRR